MKKILGVLLAGFLALTAHADAQGTASTIRNVPTIAALQALGTASGQYATVNVASYQAANNKGGGIFQWNSSSTATTDSCTVFQATGVATGRWFRQLNGPLDATMCGVWADGTHDDTTAMNLAMVAAAVIPAHKLTLPGGTIKVTSTVTGGHGVMVSGQGQGVVADSIVAPTIVDGSTMTSGWVFDINTPNGVTLYEAPKYYDMEIIASQVAGNPTGGCIRWNNIANGFTDTGASQYYMEHPHAERIYCLMNSGAGAQQIGIQCNKCFDGDISQNFIFFGNLGVDLEGSDMVSVGGAGGNRIQGQTGPMVKTELHGTFGNKNRIVGNHLLSPGDFGQAYAGFVQDGANSSVVEGNHIEGIIAGGTAVILIDNGYNHVIRDNDIAGVLNAGNTPIPCWINVTNTIANLVAIGNASPGASAQGTACYTTSLGGTKYYYNPNVRQVVVHSGNGVNGDLNWPFNSLASSQDSIAFFPNTLEYFSPSTDGLNTGGVGATVLVTASFFQLDLTGSGNYIDFGNTDRPVVTGTLNLRVLASRPLGAANLNCALTDNGVVVAYTALTLTTKPAWYAFRTGDAIATKAGVRCYPDSLGTRLYAATIGQ